MRIRFKNVYFVGIFIALLIIVFDIYIFLNWPDYRRYVASIAIIAVTIAFSQFLLDIFKEFSRQKEMEDKFLEFTRNLVASINSGIPIPRAILNVSTSDYGSLTPYIKKLAYQIEWGIPINEALKTFANDTYNKVIARSVSIIIEAEESGGDISSVLESVSESVQIIKKMRAERKSTAFTQIVQGYIVFFIFISIMLVLQTKLFSQISFLGQEFKTAGFSVGGLVSGTGQSIELDRPFFFLVLVQGIFTGIMIGKFSEGTLKNGFFHALIITIIAILIITTVKGGI
ncbi:type II secretion system F family protein [Candidatus Woesearchaeota archaeon]|nr:type II secretion system F family protein [Candidatus Woesearchaeota archaeon]